MKASISRSALTVLALALALVLAIYHGAMISVASAFTAHAPSISAGSRTTGGLSPANQITIRKSAVEDDVGTTLSSSSASSAPAPSSSPSSSSSSTSTNPRNGGRSTEEIATELSSGKTPRLEGGATVDFAGVRDETSRSERALLAARELFVAGAGSSTGSSSTTGSLYGRNEDGKRLMGINDEVVSEVGREVGYFASTYDEGTVQGCADWLRSRAPRGMFMTAEEGDGSAGEGKKVGPTPAQIETYTRLLTESYEESGIVTAAFAKTFYLGTKLMSPPAQRAIWAIYVWCRRTDEIVDAPRSPSDPDMLSDLSQWEIRTENLWNLGQVVDVLDLPLLDVRINYPKLDITPFIDMVRGMLMDIPELGQDRYLTFDELHLYCYRVAGTVGLMSMPIFGCDDGFTEEEAKEPALSLGVAFQITNILRDVGEDATTRGRVYLPLQDMEKFGVTEQQLFDQRVDDNYVALMKYEIERARMYYDRAKRGVPMLSAESRLPVQSSLDCYGKILDKIEENGYDTLTKRAYVSKWEKLFEIPFSWYRTQDIAKILPLPWDGDN
eukprot:CAMPEP_0178555698 /NCGR_PEP_ID=MMETSP0697-20121206/9000_1 /TAXON_ID=265572 /ORGANISM="Extubocellulus spinifer, Strain CCMP396" /LENGTH=554 /DNA_ID=CAMNT_0020188721 /DNA_START=242 /DNA_END=1905 /DNA_ORIENTATION=-